MRTLKSNVLLAITLAAIAPPMILDSRGTGRANPTKHRAHLYTGATKRHPEHKSDQDLARLAAAQANRERKAEKLRKQRGKADEQTP